jgi:tRNA1Val (adenine37-N6)-methyltransferase
MSFKFKHFFVDDTNTPMKVGIDAVLLGAWADASNCRKILDVGAGSGIVSLMLAQRFPNVEIISSVEVNPNAYKDCLTNFKNSIWRNKLNALLGDFTKIDLSDKFDLIISNPPFFDSGTSNVNVGRELSRKNEFLPMNIFLAKSTNVLNDKGEIYVIYPYNQRESLIKQAMLTGLYIIKELKIRDNDKVDFKRIILAFGKNKPSGEVYSQILSIKSTNGSYTDNFKKLTSDFYL